MGCGCGGAKIEALTTNQAQALIDAAKADAIARQSEAEAMVASAAQATQNANSGSTALR